MAFSFTCCVCQARWPAAALISRVPTHRAAACAPGAAAPENPGSCVPLLRRQPFLCGGPEATGMVSSRQSGKAAIRSRERW